MNNKGFAITTILYGTLILFLMLFISMLAILATYKDRLSLLIDSNNGARDIINGSAGGSAVAYVVYSEDDYSFTFYKNTDTVNVGDTYNGKFVTAIYYGFEDDTYSKSSLVPWISNADSIKKVEMVDTISPVSTNFWFYGFKFTKNMDLSKLDTSNVTTMQQMFAGAGYKSENFEIVGLDKFNTSKVTNMYGMFGSCGQESKTFNIGNISGWNVSNVTTMEDMFNQTGAGSTNAWILDLRDWAVGNVVYYENFTLLNGAGQITPPSWSD